MNNSGKLKDIIILFGSIVTILAFIIPIGKKVIQKFFIIYKNKIKEKREYDSLKEQEKNIKKYYDNLKCDINEISYTLNDFKKRWNDDTIPRQKERIDFIKKILKYDKPECEWELDLEQINKLISIKKDLFVLYENFPKGFDSSKPEKRLINYMKKHLEENYPEE